MTLNEYFNLVLNKYSNNEYTIKKIVSGDLNIENLSFHLEAQHYMMYEWCDDHWDDRYKYIFNYILVPMNCDYDFYNIKFEDFLKFLSNIKIR